MKPVFDWGFIGQFQDNQYKMQWNEPIPGYANHPEHPFLKISSQTYPSNEWCFGDNEVALQSNLKKTPEDWKYRTKKIYYNLNGSGYRTREWRDINWSESIVILGCSNTFGIAVAEDETIAYYLEDLTKRPVINLGYPSASNDTILNNSSILFEKFGIPYAVVINWSTLDRFRYYHRFNYLDIGSWNNKVSGISPITIQDNVDVSELYQLQAMDQYHLWMRNYFLSKSANATWRGRTRYVTLSNFKESAYWMRADGWIKITNSARDLIHPGSEDHLKAAMFINEKLQ